VKISSPLTLLALLIPYCCSAAEISTKGVAGNAAVDITPTEPVRLNGFGGRKLESEGIRQRLFARALAFGNTPENTTIILTVDTLGIPDDLAARVWQRIHRQIGIKRENLALCATHTHSAPMIVGCANQMTSGPVSSHTQPSSKTGSSKLQSAHFTVSVRLVCRGERGRLPSPKIAEHPAARWITACQFLLCTLRTAPCRRF